MTVERNKPMGSPMPPVLPFHVLFPLPGVMECSPFARVMETLVWGLEQLGYEASSSFGTWRKNATHIVLCPHLLGSQVLERIPPETILYNLDQITPSSPIPPSSLWSFRHWRIWDFSPKNQARWNSLGINATIVPIAWHPGLERVPNNQEKDIDVLFYGALNHHREAALNRIAGTGVRLGIYNQVFGRELDTLIARSRLVLNIHYYPTGLLETMRISYLLANGKAVLSERSIRSEIPDIYESAVCWTPYEKLAETCLELVSNSDCLKKLETAGKSSIRSIPIAPFIKQALLT